MYENNLDHEYLAIEGLKSYLDESLKLAFGKENPILQQNRIAAIQSISGTGALRIGLDFCKKYLDNNTTIYLSQPCWKNAWLIASEIHMKKAYYAYYDRTKKNLDFPKMAKDFNDAPDRSLMLIQVSCHNPTGVDPSKQQWEELKDIGYSQNVEDDAFPLRLFAKENIPILLAHAFSKNLNLYGPRVGTLSLICENETEKNAVESQLKTLARRNYSNPPLYGARIVSTILKDENLRKEWIIELDQSKNNIIKKRENLVKSLILEKSRYNWDFLLKQNGFFGFTNLNTDQVQKLRKHHHIYLTDEGRINLGGVNEKNMNYIAKAFEIVSRLQNN